MDWNDLMNQIMPYIISIVGILLGGVSLFVGKKVDAFMKRNDVYDKLKSNQLIVKASVEYVEQVFTALDGKEKFELAKQQALEIFNENGVTVSEAELNALIEQAVFQFKEGMNMNVSVEVPKKRKRKSKESVEIAQLPEGRILFEQKPFR